MGMMDGRAVLVTGAGRGVGRGIALELAKAGAAVVVNDLGVSITGENAEGSPAEQVAAEIKALGGKAVANHDSVADWDGACAMVKSAVDNFGRIDAVVNNAGNLRDVYFHKMSPEDFDAVIAVHLKGSFNTSRAAAPFFKEQGSGAYVHMTSTSGLVGNFGQANYGAAKLGLAGFTKTLHLEGAKYNVRVNSLAPVAGTRMTEDIFPEGLFEQFTPENVVPAALYLVSEDAPTNMIIGAGGGGYHAAYVTMTPGVALRPEDRNVEGFAAAWDKIIDRTGETVPQSGGEQSVAVMKALQALG